MPAQMQFDQVGLVPAGAPGEARTDGLSADVGGGVAAEVTLTSTGGGTTHRFLFLWVPIGDTNSQATLAQQASTVWTFTPDAHGYGSFRVELIVDEGLPTESRSIRIFGVRTPSGILIPALNEVADPRASLVENGADEIAASENNEPTTEFPGGSYAGWQVAMRRALLTAEGRVHAAVDAAVLGAVAVNVGMVRLPAGTLLAGSRVFAGSLTVAPDGFTLDLIRETGAVLITTWTGTGLMADRVLGADVAIPAPDWYSLSLRASGAAVTAILKGIDLTVV
jgi:hypothetical protein